MKFVYFIFLLLISGTLRAQPKLRTEIYGGVTMVRLHRSTPYSLIPGQLNFTSHTPQAGTVLGIRFSKSNRLLSNLLSIDFQRNIAYATVEYINNYTFPYGGYVHESISIHYMRWDATRAVLSWQLQLRLGPKRDVVLHTGIMVSSLLNNRSRANYWKTEVRNYYDPALGYVSTFSNELIEEKLTMQQITGILCAGATLPVPGTKFSLLANWQYNFTPSNAMFGFAERGMLLAMLYRI
jgi:hypothetical protein